MSRIFTLDVSPRGAGFSPGALNRGGGPALILSFATFLALAASCAPQVDAKTLAKGAKVESGFETLSLNDNTLKREFHPHDESEAIGLAHKLLDAGHNIDLGIMQVNSGNFGWLGLTIEEAFDPCHSISAGATELLSWSRYNTGSPTRGFSNGYVARIVAAGAELKGAGDIPSVDVAQASPQPPHDWNVFPDDDDDSDTPKQMAAVTVESIDLQQTPATPLPSERSPAVVSTELADSPPLGVPPTPQPENDPFPVTLARPR